MIVNSTCFQLFNASYLCFLPNDTHSPTWFTNRVQMGSEHQRCCGGGAVVSSKEATLTVRLRWDTHVPISAHAWTDTY